MAIRAPDGANKSKTTTMNWLIAVAKPCFNIVVRKQIDPRILIVLSRPAEKRLGFIKSKVLKKYF